MIKTGLIILGALSVGIFTVRLIKRLIKAKKMDEEISKRIKMVEKLDRKEDNFIDNLREINKDLGEIR